MRLVAAPSVGRRNVHGRCNELGMRMAWHMCMAGGRGLPHVPHAPPPRGAGSYRSSRRRGKQSNGGGCGGGGVEHV
eukprot:364844-Chlamydomonas_euryale.AAC.1